MTEKSEKNKKVGVVEINGVPSDIVDLGKGKNGNRNWKIQPTRELVESVILGHTKDGIGLDHGDVYQKSGDEIKKIGVIRNFSEIRSMSISEFLATKKTISYPTYTIPTIGVMGNNLGTIFIQRSNGSITIGVPTITSSGTLYVGFVAGAPNYMTNL